MIEDCSPFPWELTKDGVFIRDRNGIHVARLHPRNGEVGVPDDESRANAALILALPDLISALAYVEKGTGTSASAKRRIDEAMKLAGLR